MLYRARRVQAPAVQPFAWGGTAGTSAPAGAAEGPSQAGSAAPATPAARPAADEQAQLAALERDAFAKGYAQGERAGYEAGAKRAEAMLRRLAATLEELASLRSSMIQQTEQQMVQLALAVARKVIRREVALDRDLVVAMARVALDRLGEQSPATIRLHPEDLAACGTDPTSWAPSHVQVVADGSIARGQCHVESDFGFIDAGVEAQFDQVAQSLLGDTSGVPMPALGADPAAVMAFKDAA